MNDHGDFVTTSSGIHIGSLAKSHRYILKNLLLHSIFTLHTQKDFQAPCHLPADVSLFSLPVVCFLFSYIFIHTLTVKQKISENLNNTFKIHRVIVLNAYR